MQDISRQEEVSLAETAQLRHVCALTPHPSHHHHDGHIAHDATANTPLSPTLSLLRLELALANYAASTNSHAPVKFTVHFAPYQLYPALTDAGQDKRAWFVETKHAGSAERMAQFEAVMQSYADPLGVKFSWDGSTANTLHAHRVIQWFQGASGRDGDDDNDDDFYDGEQEKQAARQRYAAYGSAAASRIIDALYRMYFEEARHPSSPETLVAACVEGGIPEDEARQVVGAAGGQHDASATGALLARRKIMMSRADGVDSVPTVVFEGRRRDVTLVGAKEVFEYEKALATIVKECQ